MKGLLKKSIALVLVLVLSCLTLSGCKDDSETLQDGYYSAEMSDYSHGWKEFVTICVSNGELSTVEYNAKNASGFIKSWDMNYMRNMEFLQGTYPNLYTRTYAADLLEKGNADQVDTVTGASSSGITFKQLAAAAIQQAQKGDTSKAIVEAQSEE